jgi:hypothetical protein
MNDSRRDGNFSSRNPAVIVMRESLVAPYRRRVLDDENVRLRRKSLNSLKVDQFPIVVGPADSETPAQLFSNFAFLQSVD